MFVNRVFACPGFVPDENPRIVNRLMNIIIDISRFGTRIRYNFQSRFFGFFNRIFFYFQTRH